MAVDLTVDIAGIPLRNPVLTAAGPTSRDGETLAEAARGGVGGLVAKTISVKPAEVPRPNMQTLDRGKSQWLLATAMQHQIVHLERIQVRGAYGLLNHELWSDKHYQKWLDHEYPRAKETGLALIASMGYTPDELKQLAPLVQKAGVDGIEFSTHYIETDPKVFNDVAKTLKESVDIPIFAKMSPHVKDLTIFSKAVDRYVDGFVAINTLGPCLHIDIETGRPLLGGPGGVGWLSGPAIKPLAIRAVADIARGTTKPVIGVGGVSTGADAIEFFMVGASAVQVCTAAILEGQSVYGRIATEVAEFLGSHGHTSPEDVRGIALKHLPSETLRIESLPPTVNEEVCSGCGLCSKSCTYSAIAVNPETTKAQVNSELCYGCGVCVSICPHRALSFETSG
ncbi:MAG: 4Fe-4S binding protein [Candidatus Hermodarchaeota archaeon]